MISTFLQSLKASRYTVLFLVVLVTGTAIRIFAAASVELWADEWHLLLFSTQKDAAAFFRDYYDKINNNVLLAFYLINFAFFRFVSPDSEIVVRFLPLLFGVISLPISYLLLTRLFDEKFGFIFTLLLAFNFVSIRFSVDARPYSLTVLLSVVFMYYLALILEKELLCIRCKLLTVSALLYLFHPATILVIIPGYIARTFESIYRRTQLSKDLRRTLHETLKLNWIELILFAALSAALKKPIVLAITKKGGLGWIATPTIKDLLGFYAKCLQFGVVEHGFAFLSAALLLLTGAIAGYSQFKSSIRQTSSRRRSLVRWSICTISLVPIALFLVSLVHPIFLVRYLAFLLPITLMLLTLLIHSLPPVFSCTMLILITVCCLVSFSLSQTYDKPVLKFETLFEYSTQTSKKVGIYSYRSPAIISFFRRKYKREYANVFPIMDPVLKSGQFSNGDLLAVGHYTDSSRLKPEQGCILADTNRLSVKRPRLLEIKCKKK